MSVYEDINAPSLNVRTLADKEDVSPQTIRRRVARGEYPNAWRTSDSEKGGEIMIPLEDALNFRRRGKIYG